jgi:signal transduction histidine kinase
MRRRRRIPYLVTDTALAVVLTVPSVAGLVAEPDMRRSWWVVAPLAVAATLPVALRRYRPLEVFAVTVAALAALNGLGLDTLAPGTVVATYSLAAHCDRRVALKAGALGLAVLAPAFVESAGWTEVQSVAPDVLVLAVAWILGDNLRTRRAYLHELEEKAERLERERAENERRAAAEEQARIARELHDVIAHNVSVMVVQAAAGGEVFEVNPARAREALASIEATGRDALAELRRLLGVVTAQEDGAGSRAPQPGLGRLDTLVEQVRAAGLDVELVVEGERVELASGIDLSAYRVIQEALTNTLKHAFAKRAWVIVRYGERDVEVEVLDDGAGPPREGSPGARGLIGMRERVGLFGGELEIGPRPNGGYRVLGRFPLPEEAT